MEFEVEFRADHLLVCFRHAVIEAMAGATVDTAVVIYGQTSGHCYRCDDEAAAKAREADYELLRKLDELAPDEQQHALAHQETVRKRPSRNFRSKRPGPRRGAGGRGPGRSGL